MAATKRLGFANIMRCRNCKLLYRPTGFRSGLLTGMYYGLLYSDQGIATSPKRTSVENAVSESAAAGKDRTEIVSKVLDAIYPVDSGRTVAVIGASWGYEVLALTQRGIPSFGIELSDRMRQIGSKQYGLSMYSTPEDAAAVGRRAQLVFSSHALEHIPGLTRFLLSTQSCLSPTVHCHITPLVESRNGIRTSSVGVHHPIGLTVEYWRRWGEQNRLSYRLYEHQPSKRDGYCELLAVAASSSALLPPLDFLADARVID